MYFKSDSWGKLGSTFQALMKDEYGDYTPLGEIREIKTIVDEIFKPSGFERLSRSEILKKILEGLQMPVQNPKTGEQDYVDISLVNKIVVDSEYIENMTSNNKIKIDITLEGYKETGRVSIFASAKELDSKKYYSMDLQTFEEMLFKAINEIKNQRLEEVEDFQEIINQLISDLITDNLQKSTYLARISETYKVEQGIGIIRDIKANQDVGTFESFHYLYDKKQRQVYIKNIILSGRTMEDLMERDRFEFVFYSLENALTYSMIAEESSTIKTALNESLDIENFTLLIDKFEEDHKYFSTAMTAQSKKMLLSDIDKNHPLYGSNYEEFRQSRLGILEESKVRQKQEKIVNQFADIDF